MPDVIFEHGKAKITVRELTGRDLLRIEALRGMVQLGCSEHKKLPTSDITILDRLECNRFAELLLRSTVSGNAGFKWPDFETSKAIELYETLLRFGDEPPELVAKWLNALDEADLEKPDPEE